MTCYFYNSMYVEKQVFQLFENLKINVRYHMLFLIFQVSNIKYLAKIEEGENILMGCTH